jgi:hypothetical protein
MATPEFPIDIEQGATFIHTFHWYGGGKYMSPIEHIEVGYPTKITVTDHLLNAESPTPVIISGVVGCPDLNSEDTGIEPAFRIDDNTFEMPVSTVADDWKEGTGEITYFMPTDRTGYTGRMQIRKNWHTEEIIHECNTTNGGMLLNPIDGSIQLTIPAAVTATMKFVNGVYDVDLVDPAGLVWRVFKGTVKFHKEITR